MNRSIPRAARLASASLLIAVALCRTGLAAAPPVVKVPLALAPGILNPRADAVDAIIGPNFFIAGFETVERRPASITREPKYVGTPRYGAFRIGDGPRSVTYFAIDEAKGFAGKFYLDKNQNGDLTDDGPGEWDSMYVDTDGNRNGQMLVTVHASWGTPLEERESGDYSLILTKRDGNPKGGLAKITGRVGNVTFGDKTYFVVLGENTSDGLFTVPADADLTRAPVTLYVDTDHPIDAMTATTRPTTAPVKRTPEKFNLAHPFQIDGRWYMARPSISGATLTVQETTAPDAPVAGAPAVAPDKLPIGAAAPDFTVQTPDGKAMRLSDFKGKLVVLDFWATWCGPCQQSMPGLEKLYQRVKEQDVVVLSVCVLDEKGPFDAWIAKHADKDYHFTFAYDLAARAETGLTGSAAYDVPAIPAWFLIARDGTVAAKQLGYDGTENKLTRALRDQHVRIDGD